MRSSKPHELISAERLATQAIKRALRRGDVDDGQYTCKRYEGFTFAWFNGQSWQRLRPLCREMKALGFTSITNAGAL